MILLSETSYRRSKMRVRQEREDSGCLEAVWQGLDVEGPYCVSAVESKEETWAGDVPYCTNAFMSCTRSSLGHFRTILNASMMLSLKPARTKCERILGPESHP